MKYVVVCMMLCSFGFGAVTLAAAENEELVDVITQLEEEQQKKEVVTLQQDLAFETFSSCDDMGSVLETFLQENEELFSRGGGRGGYPMPMMAEDTAVSTRNMADGDEGGAKAVEEDAYQSLTVSDSTDVSTTNIQIEGVDEPDILKSDGEYLYYYNMRSKKIFILASPLNRTTATISMDDLRIVSTINIPETFRGTQLFIKDDTLVIIGQRRRDNANYDTVIDTSQKTDVIMYDVSDIEKPALNRFSDLDGTYHDARLIGDKLYVVSQVQINRR